MTLVQRLSKWFYYLLLLPLVLGACGWMGWRWWSWASAPVVSATATPGEDPTVIIEVSQGTTGQQIGRDLEAVNVIRSVVAWDLWTRWQLLQDNNGSFQAGVYQVSPADPLAAIATQIWQGEVVERSFTIPEGWSLEQMASYFEQEGWFTAAEFLQATEQVDTTAYPWLPPDLPRLEGFLYPDTYQVSGDPTPEAIVDQMLTRFEQVALPLYQQSESPYSLLEWVTLASIVEKEAVVSNERPTIASVFARRLRERMPLGADPTVEYGLGIRQTVEQPLTLEQVSTPSPYNTYINSGLPPTPIAAPGLASLEASLNPGDTEYLYFVARYDGTHIFSRTLEEHEAAKDQVDADLASEANPEPSAPN
jgi:UPF0755 protein